MKTEAGREQYLDSIKNIKDRTALTKIRFSNHELMIEKGKHLDLQENQRLCPLCDNKVEMRMKFTRTPVLMLVKSAFWEVPVLGMNWCLCCALSSIVNVSK